MRKILILILCMIIMTGLITGCSNNNTGSDTTDSQSSGNVTTAPDTTTDKPTDTTVEPETTVTDAPDTETTASETTEPETTEPETTEPETTDAETTDEPAPDTTGLYPLIQNGKSDYVIVYPANIAGWGLECAELMRDKIEKMTGVTLEIRTDDAAQAESELLLGDTNRECDKTPYPNLGEGYAVSRSGNKLLLASHYESGLKNAIRYILASAQVFTTKDGISMWIPENPAKTEYLEVGYFDIAGKTDLVGICYSTWFDYILQHGQTPKVIQDCIDGITPWDGVPAFHYWCHPTDGFYKSSDEAVVRRHMLQLEAAGVDFIIIDNTNGDCGQYDLMIDRPMKALINVIHELRAEGYNTPRVTFWTNNANLIHKIVNQYYTDENTDVFVYWDDKPFVVDYASGFSDENLTVRSMAGLRGTAGGQWSFLDYPSNVAYTTDGTAEQVGVCCAVQKSYMSDSSAIGRRGGLTFYEGWEVAFAAHPKIVTVTWWNELAAQRFDIGSQPYSFVDNYTEPYSRDIEPTVGGHGSTYYDWLCDYVWEYKSHKECPMHIMGGQEVNITGSVAWDFSVENAEFQLFTYNTGFMRCVYSEEAGALTMMPRSQKLVRDPYFILNTYDSDVNASDYSCLAITYMIPADASDKAKSTQGSVTACCGENIIDNQTGKAYFTPIADGEVHTEYIDLSGMTDYSGRINTLRVDFFSIWVLGDSFTLYSAELLHSMPKSVQ